MQKGRNFEKQIEKVIEYIENINFHGHKNYANRLVDGTYLKGECFDYEILLPGRHDMFDAKEVEGDRWHILKKDITQTNELKKCKNAGCNAYFLICFQGTDVRMIDVDHVINNLKKNNKTIRKEGFPIWDLPTYLKEKEYLKHINL
ncbi:MAG: Holliday junction resolvase RecU [Clostridia bacterium]|nr:Holliday junction resolvase RecU [Clostridia bacterium]